MKLFKMRVTPAQSEHVQKILFFTLGLTWESGSVKVRNTDEKFLVYREGSNYKRYLMAHSNSLIFDAHAIKEMTYDDFCSMYGYPSMRIEDVPAFRKERLERMGKQ